MNMLLTDFTGTIGEVCLHNNGWYGNVSILAGWWHIRIFVCSDCGELLQGKRLKEDRKRRYVEKNKV